MRRPGVAAAQVLTGSNTVGNAAFSHDGRYLAIDFVASNEAPARVVVRDRAALSSPPLVLEASGPPDRLGATLVQCAHAPDGALVIAFGSGTVLRVWRVVAGVASLVIACDVGVEGGALAPDGSHLFTWSPATVWDARSGAVLALLAAQEPFRHAAFSAPHRALLATTWGRGLHAFDASTGALRWRCALDDGPAFVAVSPDGALAMASMLRGAHRFVSVRDGRVLRTIRGWPYAVCAGLWSSERGLVASRVCMSTGYKTETFHDVHAVNVGGPVAPLWEHAEGSATRPPVGRAVAAAIGDLPRQYPLVAAGFTGDERRLMTLDHDGVLAEWSVGDRAKLSERALEPCTFAAFTADVRLVVAVGAHPDRHRVSTYDVATGIRVATGTLHVLPGHPVTLLDAGLRRTAWDVSRQEPAPATYRDPGANRSTGFRMRRCRSSR